MFIKLYKVTCSSNFPCYLLNNLDQTFQSQRMIIKLNKSSSAIPSGGAVQTRAL